MSQEPEDVKPKMNLIIVWNDQNVTIKVKTNQAFKKIFEAAEKRFGKEPGTFKFTYDGNRVQVTDTPAELGMEDGDQIDAHLEQVGGSISS
ncbi:ubiquitin-related domain-containing protein [Mycena floridula]|nr:ubiquitin-related domain-containing protein [Mycena floridula]